MTKTYTAKRDSTKRYALALTVAEEMLASANERAAVLCFDVLLVVVFVDADAAEDSGRGCEGWDDGHEDGELHFCGCFCKRVR